MDKKPSKFWAYISVAAGIFLILSGVAAAVGYFGLPLILPFDDALTYELGNIAALYLGLLGGGLAVYHGFSSISKRNSSPIKFPSFYIFWIILGLVLGLGTLVLENDISVDFIFPPIFVLGAALSTLAVIAWAYRKMGFPITWRQASLAFVSGSTLSIIVTILLGTLLYYIGYLLIQPLWYLAEEIAHIGWDTPGFIERLFASPLILVFLVVTALQAPIPEEFAKALGIPLFGRARIQNERQAFAIGLACGAGFAVLENMLYEGIYANYYGWGWAGITLLRSIGTVLHPIGTGIIALGWFRMKEGGGAGKLFKAYLLSVGLHTLWNGGFEPLLYLTGLEYFAGEGLSISLYGETLSTLLVGYLVLLSLGLWWLLRKILNEISERVTPELEPAPVSKRALATWAVACAFFVIPIGATFSPAWNAISTLFVDGEIRSVQYPRIGDRVQAQKALANNVDNLEDLSNDRPDFSKITQPGDIYSYRINMNDSKPVIWSYTWCTTTEDILDENFENIQLDFVVGDTVIPDEHLATHEFERSNSDGMCREYYTIITDFPRGRHHLEIRVTFTQDLNDGWDVYPAGTHYYEYIVIVKR